MKSTTPKPLATVGKGRNKIEIHRGKFHAFEAMKYVNVQALKEVPKARIEIGRVKCGGVEATIAAEIEKGIITRLVPLDCRGCHRASNKSSTSKASKAARKKVVREALMRIRDLDLPTIQLPVPLGSAESISNGGIPKWPDIVLIFDWNPFDICLTIRFTDGAYCALCLFSGAGCIYPA